MTSRRAEIRSLADLQQDLAELEEVCSLIKQINWQILFFVRIETRDIEHWTGLQSELLPEAAQLFHQQRVRASVELEP